MATGALITAARPRRALYAAGVLATLVAALLGVWFYSGWNEVRQRQRDISQAPRVAAASRADELARELRAQLDGLVAREFRRPYFHYQNLMRDPNASPGLNVSPSPLARGPEDELVLGYFQLDAKGRVTTPTINDEVPSLSEPERLANNQAFRLRVTQDLSPQLVAAIPVPPQVVARLEPTPPPPAPAPVPVPSPPPAPVFSPPPRPQPEAGSPTQQTTQVVTLDRNVYTQNTFPNRVFSQRVPQPVPARASAPVTITISPLEWRTLPFEDAPALVAIRHVQTPDGGFAQGFVVNRSMLNNWLATRANGMVVELVPADSPGAEVAPGWRLTVEPNPHTVAQAAADAGTVPRTFLMQFIAMGTLAIGAAVFVVVLVRRAESLAFERSRFAAAAAHELRTPLAGLQLYGDLLAEGLGDPGKTRDYARRMSEEASRLGRVVSNVLGFSQLERGQLSIDAQAGSLGDALRELAEQARPALDRAGVRLELDVPPTLRARFDRDALARIVGNLIDNAEKYARGAADRTIRLAACDRGGGVEVTVEDRGPGITDATKLFTPFSRGATGSDAPDGLGLGLALSMSLARAMDGELVYQPRDGGGATFVLRLRSG